MQTLSTDAKLRRAIWSALMTHHAVKTRFIDIGVRNGRVAISGWVTSHVQKCAVDAAVLRVPGVQALASTLAVALPSAQLGDDRPLQIRGRLTLTSLANQKTQSAAELGA